MGSRDAESGETARNEVAGAVSGQVVQAGSVGSVHFHGSRAERGMPAQLPLAPRSFAGREAELTRLRRLREALPEGSLLVVLTGPAGVGKTSLALRWLHELRAEFPDGQLFADLGAAQPVPVAPTEVLDWFLVSAGVAAERVPVGQPRREAMYRSVTSTRRLVVLLDNVVSAAQVRALVPAGVPSVVVATSRYRLSGLALDGARWVDVAPLDEAGSLSVLHEMLGAGRVTAEAEAARTIAELCGGMPLALSVVGARLAARPRRSLDRELADLRVDQRRLPALTLTGDVSVGAVLDAACDGLAGDAAHLYRLCAFHLGREFGTEVAAAAAGWPADRTESTLDELVEANLVAEVGDGRFAYHDLLRLHARRRAELDDPEQHAVVVHRMTEWYLGRAVCADVVVHPARPRLGPRYRDARPEFADARAALSWLETERVNLRVVVDTAAGYGWPELAWQMCEALWGFFLNTRHYGDWIKMHRTGIAAARQCGDARAEARMRSQLGFAYAKLRRFDDAVAENTAALRLAEEAGDDQACAIAQSQLGRAARGLGDLPAALAYFEAARDAQVLLGEWRGVALCRRRIGDLRSRLGDHDGAVGELMAAAAEMARLGDRTQHARTLMFLGAARLRADRADLADAPLLEALGLMQALGSPYYQAEILAQLGEVAERRADRDVAAGRYREAAELYAAVEDPRADVMRSRLSALESG
ncbi:MAG: tetratricopeptide repeat protein [Actinophytocola sp.]|uniref:tetratricopeptide repeat protein n=1 Tax=Actinophytocola sp. TaxID=1872138 RepID=UPI001324AD59|nr:tetratricopeptide repeat protein [Actinophytocola sp.]MPZ79838.1 tetratricopeptide repeat protein [Actinophytocola sp.]